MAVEPGTRAARILDQAVQRLAAVDVLVLTAAGNDGSDVLTSPATSRGSFSVGAVDDRATADRSDDVVAAFSGTGVDSRGVAQPDVVASGVAVTGSLPQGSVIASTATATDGLYSGTGTSMATAVAAGVAALASSARPDLGGAALDAALRAGGGVLDAPAAVAAALAAPTAPGSQADPQRNGGGNGGGKGNGNGSDGSVASQSIRWTSIRWTSIRWTGESWGDNEWGMAVWGSIRWTSQGWQYADVTPQTIRWTTIRWTTIRWTALN
jgi:hypothetical protein